MDLTLLKKARKLVKKGYNFSRIKKELGINEEVYEIARAQIRYKEKFSRPVILDLESGRLATHEIIADYHAKRLKTDVISDLGCGVGIQAIMFTRYSRLVYGVEIDKKRLEYAKINAEIYGVDNLVLINGDVFDSEIKKRLSDSDVIFSDPARPYSEEIRSLDSCKPDPRRIVKEYSPITSKFAFDLPPQIRRERVDIPGKKEFEYISLGGEFNRLTLYLNELALVERSAVMLPDMFRLEFDPTIKREIEFVRAPERYLYDVDGAVFYSDLIPEVQRMFGFPVLIKDSRRAILTGDNEVHSPVFRARYVVLELGDLQTIVKRMREENIGKVFLRFRVEPSRYYKIRDRLESKVSGENKGYLFRLGDKYILARKF